MFKLENIIRDNVKKLVPYSSARDDFRGREGIFLDANENSYGSAVGEGLNRYPDPLQTAVKEKIAALRNIDPGQVFIGNGSDEIIDLLMRAFCNPGRDSIVIMPPTYGVYEVYAGVNDVGVQRVNLRAEDFSMDITALLQAVHVNTRLIFICSPNNPTGNCMDIGSIKEIAATFEGIVVMDEAYIDFTGKTGCLSLLNAYPNLFVMQTFSKAWGLAGIRLGVGYAAKNIVDVLNKIKPPYNINAVTQRLALSAFENTGRKEQWVKVITAERDRLAAALKTMPVVKKVYPSDANFLLVKVSDADKMYDYLTERKIIVRNRSRIPLCEGCLRMTIGTPEENDKLIEAMTNDVTRSGTYDATLK